MTLTTLHKECKFRVNLNFSVRVTNKTKVTNRKAYNKDNLTSKYMNAWKTY